MSSESTPDDHQEEFHDTTEAIATPQIDEDSSKNLESAVSSRPQSTGTEAGASTAHTATENVVHNPVSRRESDSSRHTTVSSSARPQMSSRHSSQITPPGTTVTSPGKDGKAPTAAASGWKGWLRSASSARTPSFRLEMPFGRSAPSTASVPTTISATPHTDLREQFESLRLRADPELAQKVALEDEKTEDVTSVKDKDTPEIDWAYWESILTSSDPRETPGLMAHVQHGIPDILRGVVWQALAGSKDLDLEEVYDQLSAAGDTNAGEYDKQIAKDVKRINKATLRSLEERSKVSAL